MEAATIYGRQGVADWAHGTHIYDELIFFFIFIAFIDPFLKIIIPSVPTKMT